MELRSCSHFHFIQAIKCGLVVKLPNVTHGRPALAFKHINEIYEAAGAKHHDSVATYCPKQKFECSEFDPDRVRFETPCTLKGEGKPVIKDPNSCEFNCEAVSEGKNNLDDTGFGNMTLKQIKQSCNSRKRKRANFIDSGKEALKIQSDIKCEPEEDEFDLMEPLSIWKSKIVKNKKSKRKGKRDLTSTSTRGKMSKVKSKQILCDQNFLQPSGNLPTPVDIKVEVNESDFSSSHPTITVSVGASSQGNELVTSSGMGTDEVHVDSRDYVLETGGSTYPREEQFCAFNKESDKCVEFADAKYDCNEQLDSCVLMITDQMHGTTSGSLLVTDASTSNGKEQFDVVKPPCKYTERAGLESVSEHNKQVYSCGLVTDEVHVDAGNCSAEIDESTYPRENVFPGVNGHTFTEQAGPKSVFYHIEQVNSCGIVINYQMHGIASQCPQESDKSASCEENPFCAVNKASYEYAENADPKSEFSGGVSGWELIKMESPEIISYQSSDFPVAIKNKECMFEPLPDNVCPEPISMIKNCDCSYLTYNSQGYSTDDMSWENSRDSQVQLLDMDTDNRLQCTEAVDGHNTCLYEDGTKDNLPSHVEANNMKTVGGCGSRNSSSCLSPTNSLASVADDSPLKDDDQLFLSASADVPTDNSEAINCSDSTSELLIPTKPEVSFHSQQHRPPDRFFSTRKAISPTSREKLLKAMNSNDSSNDKCPGSRRKLGFAKQNKESVIAGTYSKIRRTEVTIDTEQIHKRPRNDKKGSPPKGALKAPHISTAVPSFSSGCTSTQKLQQSAIAFSQRQMQDIESLATKLTEELSYMREIVKETWHSEACPAPATSYQHHVDKVTKAIKNASKAEETAKRWLSIMARDCNRFCKIMKLTELGSPASNNKDHKKGKKIMFADEAGGELCHVKVFKDDVATQPESSDILDIHA